MRRARRVVDPAQAEVTHAGLGFIEVLPPGITKATGLAIALERYGVELIGANYDAIGRAEDRDLFRQTMEKAGLRMPRSAIVTGTMPMSPISAPSDFRSTARKPKPFASYTSMYSAISRSVSSRVSVRR